jgi:tetratricopeptide (TPR) repeat protein
MPQTRNVGLLLGTTAIVGLAAGLGLWWCFPQRSADPVREGWAAYERGQWDVAAEVARARVKTKGDDADALRLLARASVRLGRDDSARAFFRRLGSQAMQSDDLCLLGIALTRMGDNQGALQVWEQARAQNPNDPETLFELTRAYMADQRPVAASETARLLGAHPGWEAKAELLLGSIYLVLNDPERAVIAWEQALERAPTAHARADSSAPPVVPIKDMARALLAAGQPASARHRLQPLLTGRPDPEVHWLLSRAYLQEHAMTEALEHWNLARSFRDNDPLAPEPARFVGSLACAPCHRGTAHSQQGSRHAHTFFRGTELGRLELPLAAMPDPGQPQVSQSLERIGTDRLQQETRVEGQTLRAVVEYAFGSGDRGLTLVGHDQDGQARELRLSHYQSAKIGIWDVTAGHSLKPTELAEYLGQALSADSVRRCLLCHVTDPRSVLENAGPGSTVHGIGCEKCHGPGENHLLAVAAKFPDLAIGRPSLASGPLIVNLCGQCHSPLGRSISPEEPTSVRFQATTLTWSRCFTESENSFDCLTCHDPHRDVDRSIPTYESKCLTCHSGTERPGPPPQARRPTRLASPARPGRCPVNPTGGCIGCHMPTVADAVPHSAFTDHFIRVHRD